MPNRLLKLLADNRQAPARRFEVVAKDDADEAELFLYDAIVDSEIEAEYWGGVAPQSFVKALRGITAGTIHLRINSPGGSVFAARAIEQALREHKARVVVHIDGLAASAATFIAMAADEVVIAKGALFMIHKAWTVAWGNADDLTETAGLLDKIDGTLAETYADRTGQKAEQVAEWMAAETWFTAQEAVDNGFADRIAETEAKAAAWNLSAYAKAPAAAPAATETPNPAPHAAQAPQPGLTLTVNVTGGANVSPEDIAAAFARMRPAEPVEAFASEEHRERQAQRVRVLSRARIG